MTELVRLHINIDHVATLRNARGTSYPDPVVAAHLCIDAGACGITAHLREDRRHIIDSDIERIRASLPTQRLNLEMAATDEMLAIAMRVQPDVVTLVPERREERTTEGGLDVVGGGAKLAAYVKRLTASVPKVSLFIAADDAQIRAAAALHVAQIELHTGEYAHAVTAKESGAVAAELRKLLVGAELGRKLGLEVAAGHGLTCDNVPAIAAIEAITELNIGHAVISDALFVSLPTAVREMRDAISEGVRARHAATYAQGHP